MGVCSVVHGQGWPAMTTPISWVTRSCWIYFPSHFESILPIFHSHELYFSASLLTPMSLCFVSLFSFTDPPFSPFQEYDSKPMATSSPMYEPSVYSQHKDQTPQHGIQGVYHPDPTCFWISSSHTLQGIPPSCFLQIRTSPQCSRYIGLSPAPQTQHAFNTPPF